MGICYDPKVDPAILTKLEDTVTEKFGRGACISIDRVTSGWTVRVWNPKGTAVLHHATDARAETAVRKALRGIK